MELQTMTVLGTRLAGGDARAVEDVYEALGPRVLSYLRRLVPYDEAEDVMQRVFFEVWRSRDRFEPRPQPRGLGVRHRPQAGHRPPAPAAPDPAGRRPARPGWRHRPRALIGLAAALALALVTAAVLWTGGLLRPDRSTSTVPLAGVGAVAASGQASMAGDDGQRQMTVTADDLPALRPGQYYEVWLLDPDAGAVLPVGVLPPDGEARFTLPASVVGRYRVIDVSLEADDGDPTHSKRSLLRGRYA
jgi:hypothetical protein